ncbi:MAG: isoprenyl transferase [Bdellovibrionota bacterium]
MSKLPRHIAIIMDGNGRWAEKRGHNRVFGHARGAERAREITRECARLGVEALTLYTFSTENWQRPAKEVNFLMKLLSRYLKHEIQQIVNNNFQFRPVGFIDMLPAEIHRELVKLREATAKNDGMFLNIALSYGSRQEITTAVKGIAADVAAGRLPLAAVNEEEISRRLFTHESPDPDLVIRTGGDQRISNFLLWQSAYSELYFTEKCWPDFKVEDLQDAIASYSARERRFGKVLNLAGPRDESRA